MTVALLPVVVIVHFDRFEWQNSGKLRIDLITLASRFAIRLVSNNNEQETFALQALQRSAGAVGDDEPRSDAVADTAYRCG